MSASHGVIVCDACSIIFLIKIEKEELIFQLLGDEVRVMASVIDEIRAKPMSRRFNEAFSLFLKRIEIVLPVENVDESLTKLSHQDFETLNYCLQKRPRFLLTDDSLLRKMVSRNDIRVVGTIGILLKSVGKNLISNQEAQGLIDQLVRRHEFRISPTLLSEVQKSLR